MRNLSPICSGTKIDSDNHVWIPRSFSDFLCEVHGLGKSLSGESPLPLFRGHAESKWLLESTFGRSCKRYILGLEPDERIPRNIQDSVEYHRVALNLFLLKYGVIVRPFDEDTAEIDAWFELMRDFQQYPEKDHHHFKGTFFLDWSQSLDVALFFANADRKGDGALWICDAVATGQTLQIKLVGEILDIMDKRGNSSSPNALGCPLIFHPPATLDERVRRQQAVYIAQMDMRVDLADIWRRQEVDNKSEQIFLKLVLPDGTQKECNSYLLDQGITASWLFPEEETFSSTQ